MRNRSICTWSPCHKQHVPDPSLLDAAAPCDWCEGCWARLLRLPDDAVIVPPLALVHSSLTINSCPCNGRSASQVDLSEPLVEESTDFLATNDLTNDWTMNFSNFISRYHKPENPCDYCRLRHLDCFLTFEGQTGCSPCNALFRTCSFDIPAQQRKPRNMIDTLHQVSEDVCQEFGALTSTKTMVGIKTDEDRAARKSGIRFSRASVKILTDWIVSHSDHPYPTEDEKAELRQRTGLTESQVNNWLANARRRKKHKPKRPASPSLQSSSAIDIALEKSWSEKNPMERYLE